MKTRILILSLFLCLVVGGIFLWKIGSFQNTSPGVETGKFDGERALNDIRQQLDFGPRIPGSLAQSDFLAWLTAQLQASGWVVEIQDTSYQNKPIKNLIASRGSGDTWFILGAHYDSRLRADRDPNPLFRATPVPGANDGASGVAVLLELARVLPPDLDEEIWLVFFDSEDNGGIEDWDWILGSRAFVKSLPSMPDAAIIVDMVGDADLEIPIEKNSDPLLSQEIWQIAAGLGYDQFSMEEKYRILDDHVPFIEMGIPAVDIIDIEYKYYHTTDDTVDKVSSQSLQAVGDTLLTWLMQPR